jgi:hypothetical protein
VGVHCDLAEVDRRERDRGDRRIGEGRSHVETGLIHKFGPSDFEVDTTVAISTAVAESVLAAWRTGSAVRTLGKAPQHPSSSLALPSYRRHELLARIVGRHQTDILMQPDAAVTSRYLGARHPAGRARSRRSARLRLIVGHQPGTPNRLICSLTSSASA